MQELINKANLDQRKLKSVITKLAAGELSKISEICYYPPLKAPYFQLLHAVGLQDKDIKDFKKRLWEKHPAKGWNIHNVPATVLLVFIMRYFLAMKDKEGFLMTVLYLLVRFYGNIMSIQIKYCNSDTFRYALENLTRTHLFVREKTISNGILFLAKELARKWEKDINRGDIDSIAKFITEARHRMNQSIKSFAKAYYASHEKGAKITTQKEPESDDEANLFQYQVMERGKKAIDDIVRKITIYKQIDKRAVEDARKLTKVNNAAALLMVSKLANLKYSENIKNILQQFLKDLDNIKLLCGSGFIKYVQKLMAVKRTKSTIYFKQQVNVLLEVLLKDTNQSNWYMSLTAQTKFAINSFLAFYICFTFKNSIC